MPHSNDNWIKTSWLVKPIFMCRKNRRINNAKYQIEDNRHKILDQEKLLRAFCRYTPIILLSTPLNMLIVKVRSVCIDAMAVSNPCYSTIYVCFYILHIVLYFPPCNFMMENIAFFFSLILPRKILQSHH